MKVHNLYRCFDDDGELLYVGISWSAANRFGAHSKGSAWWSRVALIKLERLPSRRDAEKAEKAAIREERPPFNRTHSTIGPTATEPDPGLSDWQVVGASRNDRNTWDVELLPPGGEPDMGALNIPALSADIAIKQALKRCAELLAWERSLGKYPPKSSDHP